MSRAEKASIEAAEWLIACEDGPLSPPDQARFDAWFAASERNKAAYWRIEAAWEEADRITALGPVNALLDEKTSFVTRRRWRRPLALAASIALAIGVSLLFPSLTAFLPLGKEEVPVRQAYATSVGMKKLIGLQDGSRIQLNTQSLVRTQISAARREVWLDKGEAFFDVAHRKDRPFIVHAGDRQITVLGTKFSVRRDGEKIIVSVLEGRVRVDELKGDRLLRSSVIVGGNIAMAEGPATLVAERSEEQVERALSWRTGMLTFAQTPLPAIAAEFNRYNVKKIVIDGETLENVRISGTFPSEQAGAFTRLLRDAYGFRVEETASEIRISD